jgi:hypothetical protein
LSTLKSLEDQYQESSKVASSRPKTLSDQDEYRKFAKFFIGESSTNEERVNRSGAMSRAWEERALEVDWETAPSFLHNIYTDVAHARAQRSEQRLERARAGCPSFVCKPQKAAYFPKLKIVTERQKLPRTADTTPVAKKRKQSGKQRQTPASFSPSVRSLSPPNLAVRVVNSSGSSKKTNKKKLEGSGSEPGSESPAAKKICRWTKEQDAQLRLAVDAVGARNWKAIAAEYLHGARTDVQCLHRWQKVLRPGLKKGNWTEEEDKIILLCMAEGVSKWAQVAARIQGRIGKQCRERWQNHLDPSINKSAWEPGEDLKLVEAQAELGNAWCQIAKLLPGRSENAVKNRWNSATLRRLRVEKS